MAERTSLQQFQTDLARKLAESVDRPMASGWLGVSWRGVRALLPLTQAAEIFNPVALQRLPHTQGWVLGVANLRGGLSLVIDWVRLLGLEAQAPERGGDETVYWVHLNPALGVDAALCVDHLLGLRGSDDMVAVVPGPAVAGIKRRCRDRQAQEWVELDMVGLCASPSFMDPRLPAFARPVTGRT